MYWHCKFELDIFGLLKFETSAPLPSVLVFCVMFALKLNAFQTPAVKCVDMVAGEMMNVLRKCSEKVSLVFFLFKFVLLLSVDFIFSIFHIVPCIMFKA